jgi:Pectinacetylesterase
MTRTRLIMARLVVLVVFVFAATVAACGSSDETHRSKAPTTPVAAKAHGWKRIVPGGDCKCSHGSKFSFWVRQANPTKVVLFLESGGGCFSARTCAPGSELYNPAISPEETPAGDGGIFDFSDRRNPFADYSFVYVPYCTADVHLGNVTRTYARGITVHHKGFVNGSAALAHLTKAFPDATNVVVAGESAGSVAAPVYGALVSDRLPKARITVLADGSGTYPDLPRFNRAMRAWGLVNALPAWTENPGRPAARWTFPGLFIQSGRHAPKVVFARHDYAYDDQQARWYPIIGMPVGNLLARINRNERLIEGAGVKLLSYTARGREHTLLSDGPFYTQEVGGRRFVDWVRDLIEGKPVHDVRCTKCS